MDKEEFDVVIPIAAKDLEIAMKNIKYIRKNLRPRDIYIISNSEVKDGISDCKWIDENTLYEGMTFKSISNIMDKLAGTSKRAGWYFQQFLKMAYAYKAKSKYYLVWDADTIPLKNISFFDEKENIPLFNIKTEYHKPYFETLNKLLGLEKKIQGSFISEHMMFDKDIMIELIQKIEENKRNYGEKFYEKILYAINNQDLLKSGFSEFETYGTFLLSEHPQNLKIRELRTLREGKKVLGENCNEEMLKWASRYYDTVSFEKQQQSSRKSYFAKYALVRKLVSFKQFKEWCIGKHDLI